MLLEKKNNNKPTAEHVQNTIFSVQNLYLFNGHRSQLKGVPIGV